MAGWTPLSTGTNGNSVTDPRFSGKKWGVLGDSISQNKSLDNNKKYYDYVGERLGLTPTTYAVGGMGYTVTMSGTGTTTISVQIDNMIASGVNYDFISLKAGTNDGAATVGTVTDTTSATASGAFRLALEKAIASFPNARIFVLTGIPAETKYGNLTTTLSNFLRDFSSNQKEICKMYSIPCLDLFRESGLTPWNAIHKATYFIDSIHPNTLGHERLSYKIENFMKSL